MYCPGPPGGYRNYLFLSATAASGRLLAVLTTHSPALVGNPKIIIIKIKMLESYRRLPSLLMFRGLPSTAQTLTAAPSPGSIPRSTGFDGSGVVTPSNSTGPRSNEMKPEANRRRCRNSFLVLFVVLLDVPPQSAGFVRHHQIANPGVPDPIVRFLSHAWTFSPGA